MRYFSESATGQLITNPDLDHGSVTPTNNRITIEYESDTGELAGHYETIKENKKTGAKIVEWIADEDNSGSWHVYDYRGGVKREVNNSEIIVPDDLDKSIIHESYETIGIYHAFSITEQTEYNRVVAENEAMINRLEDMQEWREGLFDNSKSTIDTAISDIKSPAGISGSLDNYALQTDQSIADLWEAIEELQPTNSKNKIKPSMAVAHKYANLVKRGLLNIKDIKEPMASLVKKILEEENK